MRIRRHFTLAAGLLAMVLPALAVTNEEIAKMRQVMPDKPVIQPERPRRMLVFSLCKGFNHSSIPYWAKALDIMAEKTGAFAVEHSTDMSVFTPETLSRFDAVCFNNTTHLTFDDAQKKALMDFVKGGKGIVGIHAATDNFYEWPEAAHMIGGIFQGHPWTSGGTWAIKLDESDHPLLKPFGGKGFKVNDEIYRTNPPYYSRDKQRVLMSLDMSDPATRNVEGLTPDDEDTGISWIKPYGKGRVFYCSLGHNHHLTWTRPVLEHYLAGIQYALGDLKVDDTPLGEPAPKLDITAVKTLVEKIRSYDWDKSRSNLTDLEEMIRRQTAHQGSVEPIEQLLIPLLDEQTNLAVKDFVCRKLSIIGTSHSVPALAALLDNPKTEHLARYALERIPDPAAEAALLAKLNQARDAKTKTGLISSLGIRRSNQAVNALAQIAAADKNLSQAAVHALGLIGTSDAAAALQTVRGSLAGELRPHVLNAMVICADQLTKDGKTKEALVLYEMLYAKDNPSLIRVAALTGISQTSASRFQEILPSAVMQDDAVLQAGAIRLVAQTQDATVVEAVVSAMPQLTDPARIALLSALAANGHPTGCQAAREVMASANKDVRIAAYRVLGAMGNGKDVLPLATAAARAADRAEREAARQALNQLGGQDAAAAIEEGIRRTIGTQRDEAVATELIRAVGQRGEESLKGILFAVAKEQEGRAAQEAFRSLQMMVSAEDVPAAADLLAARPGSAAETVALAAAEKIADPRGRAAALLARLESVQTPAAQASFLRVLGRLGDPQAVEMIRRFRQSSDTTVRQAALRAMLDWPGMDFFQDVRQLAVSAEDESQKILAFRAYIRLLTNAEGKTESQIVQSLAEAMKLADRPQEQKLVLAALGGYGITSALELALKAAGNPELKAEAEAAIVNICDKLATTAPDLAQEALQTTIRQTPNAAIKERAQKILDEIDKRIGYIISWQAAGPYEANNYQQLFDTAFTPEVSPEQVQWRPLPKSEDPSTFWLMDLDKAFGGTHRAAYARTVIILPEKKDAILEIGSDDGVKVWLNGRLIHANNVQRPVTPADDKVNVQLREGENEILMKIIQSSGGWGFCLRVTNPDGSPMRGLRVK
jgi:type 1 glutamine amidotransferase/HEAT repeat protein